jgi:hypothetical protein
MFKVPAFSIVSIIRSLLRNHDFIAFTNRSIVFSYDADQGIVYIALHTVPKNPTVSRGQPYTG